MLLQRLPSPRLRPFVRTLWASCEDAGSSVPPRSQAAREHVLPTGCMHIAFRLSGPEIHLFESRGDTTGRSLGHAVVGGPRGSFYARRTSPASPSVGVELQPGAAQALLGHPGEAFAHRHTSLDAVWGNDAGLALDRLADEPTLDGRLGILEALLIARLAGVVRAVHPAVAHGLRHLGQGAPVARVVDASGCSHRRFIALFRDAVGLAPKTYERVLRFQGAVASLALPARRPLVDVAMDAGYSDQSHFNREFLALAGIVPQAYRRAAPTAPNHVAM